MLEEKGGDLAEEVKRRVRSVVRVRKGIINEVSSVIGIRSDLKRVEIQEILSGMLLLRSQGLRRLLLP